MSDFRQIEVTVVHRGKVDVARFFTEFDEEWQDFIGTDEPDDEAREEFISETVHEMGVDVFDEFCDDFTSEVDDIDIPKPKRKASA